MIWKLVNIGVCVCVCLKLHTISKLHLNWKSSISTPSVSIWKFPNTYCCCVPADI